MNIPNKLTILRILLIPFFLTFFFFDWNGSRLIALLIFAIASITDMADGIIARKRDKITDFGIIMDPLADKLLVSSALIALAWTHEISPLVAIVIISREFIITGFRTLAASRNLIMSASITGKGKTVCQMIMVIFILANFTWMGSNLIKQILITIVLIITIVSAIEYIIKNRKIFKQMEI